MKAMHPSQLQIEEYISGDCGFWTTLGIRWHLWHCGKCRQMADAAMASRQEQMDFSSEVKRYVQAAEQAEETLKGTLSKRTS